MCLLDVLGYEPVFFPDAARIDHAAHAHLRSIIGSTITTSWVAWNDDDDVWWPDAPLILQTDATQVEFIAYDTMFGWTSDRIDPSSAQLRHCDEPLHIPRLSWRSNALQALQQATDQRILGIDLCEHPPFDSPHWFLFGIELRLPNGVLSIFNALDELGVRADPIPGPVRRVHLDSSES